MKLEIVSAGPLSTIQDLGRFDYMDSGFSPSGALDCFSASIANLLVGNSRNEGVIEMTALGITAKFDCDCVVALTGADMQARVNGEEVAMNRSLQMHSGDIISMKSAVMGVRAYLAVACGFDIEPVMGSVSTNLKCSVGGFNGRKLAAGDELPLRHSTTLDVIGEKSFAPPPFSSVVRAVPGPQDDYFSEQALKKFFSTVFTVSPKSDRMGIRLTGESIEAVNGVDIISDGIVTGSVQIPSSGEPIVMMADRQTTGGYAKIATVITPDLKHMAQLRAGDSVRFEHVSSAEAEKINIKEKKFFVRLEREFLAAR